MFEIEKGVPVTKKAKYSFESMEVGDSFFLSVDQRRKFSNTASGWGKRNGKKFIVRKVDGGFRCWRTE